MSVLVSSIIAELEVNSEFNSLSDAQQIAILNSVLQQVADLYNDAGNSALVRNTLESGGTPESVVLHGALVPTFDANVHVPPTRFFLIPTTVANQAARLALAGTISIGTYVFQTDTNYTYKLISGTGSSTGDWQIILTGKFCETFTSDGSGWRLEKDAFVYEASSGLPTFNSTDFPKGKIVVAMRPSGNNKVWHSDSERFVKEADSMFTFNRDIGLRRWRSELAKIKTGASLVRNICVLGDSITEGKIADASAANYRTLSFVGRLRTQLNTKYGDAGLGFVPSFFPVDGSEVWTYTGAWANNTVYGVTLKSKETNANGDTAEIVFNGTGFGLVIAKSSTAGTFSIAIDGGAPTNFNGYSAAAVAAFKAEITGLAAGAHTAVITNTSTSYLRIIGAYPIKGTTGFQVNVCGRTGTKVSDHTSANAMMAELDIWNPALTIIALHSNDYANQIPLATYQSGLQTLITQAKLYGDVLLVSNGLRVNVETIPLASYAKVMRNLAFDNSCAYLDLFTRWGGDFDYANDTLGLFNADEVHPNAYGHMDIATALLAVLDEY